MPDPTDPTKTNDAPSISHLLGGIGERSMNADTAQVVAAYLSHNTCSPEQIPGLIVSVHSAFSGLIVGAAPAMPAAPKQEPAVPVKKSVFPDHIVCLEDGKQMKMLKRHLMTAYSMTPDQYRAKWGLPPDYPMVAPEYAKKRSSLAKDAGLGRKRPDAAAEGAATTETAPATTETARVLRAPKKTGSAKKGKAAAA
jgi:predicted transcriptional regulator